MDEAASRVRSSNVRSPVAQPAAARRAQAAGQVRAYPVPRIAIVVARARDTCTWDTSRSLLFIVHVLFRIQNTEYIKVQRHR